MELLTTAQLADLLGIQPQTLRKWAMEGRGPRRVKVGRLTRYRLGDVSAWLDANASESDEDGQGAA